MVDSIPRCPRIPVPWAHSLSVNMMGYNSRYLVRCKDFTDASNQLTLNQSQGRPSWASPLRGAWRSERSETAADVLLWPQRSKLPCCGDSHVAGKGGSGAEDFGEENDLHQRFYKLSRGPGGSNEIPSMINSLISAWWLPKQWTPQTCAWTPIETREEYIYVVCRHYSEGNLWHSHSKLISFFTNNAQSQKQPSILRMAEPIVVPLHNGITSSNTEEWVADTCDNLDEPQKHCWAREARRKRTVSLCLYPVIALTWYLRAAKTTFGDRKQNHGCWWGWGWGEKGDGKDSLKRSVKDFLGWWTCFKSLLGYEFHK